MDVDQFEPNELVTYRSTQRGLPDAYHERHFDRDGAGFVYGLVVEYEPRAGLGGFSTGRCSDWESAARFGATFAELAHEFEARAA